jgi:hypothetical protein
MLGLHMAKKNPHGKCAEAGKVILHCIDYKNLDYGEYSIPQYVVFSNGAKLVRSV